MPIGFSFRPNELKSASRYARQVLECLECGQVVKKSTTNNPKNRGFVGCRNNRLLALASFRIGVREDPGSKTSADKVQFMASFYSRLAEHFELGGPHIGATAFNRQRFKKRQEQNGLKSLIYQSLCTTIQAHFKISKTRMMEHYGTKPGGYPVPDEERPLRFQFHFNKGKFRPWPCVRREGCVCAEPKMREKNNPSDTCTTRSAEKDAMETRDENAVVPVALEACILDIIEADGNNRRFKTLQNALQQKSAFYRQLKNPNLLGMLKHLQREGKVAMKLENMPRHPNTSLTNLGRRRLIYLKQLAAHQKSKRKTTSKTQKGMYG